MQTLDDDTLCDRQLGALVDPHLAEDPARNAGTREVAAATVVSLNPPRLEVASRRFQAGTVAVLLQLNGEPVVERTGTALTVQRGSFRIGGMAVAPLVPDPDGGFGWNPPVTPPLAVGDRLVLADGDWFERVLKSGQEVAVRRPALDQRSAPKPGCTTESYAEEPEEHQWRCRPHETAEAEWSDELAARRERGELNPQVDRLTDKLALPDGVLVASTVDSWQGQTNRITIALHPLSGASRLDEFKPAFGRLAVTCTRATHGLLVLARSGLDELLATPPARPGTPFGEPGTRTLPRQTHHRILAAFPRGQLAIAVPRTGDHA